MSMFGKMREKKLRNDIYTFNLSLYMITSDFVTELKNGEIPAQFPDGFWHRCKILTITNK